MDGFESSAGLDGDGAHRVDQSAGPVRLGEDLLPSPLTFYRRRNPDGSIPLAFDPRDGGGLAVRSPARRGACAEPLDHPSDAANDRCELRGPKRRLETDAWEGFPVRGPEGVQIASLRFVVAQIKMPLDASGDGSPGFALRIDEGCWRATVEHLYEPDEKAGKCLSTLVGSACADGAPAFGHTDFNRHDGPTCALGLATATARTSDTSDQVGANRPWFDRLDLISATRDSDLSSRPRQTNSPTAVALGRSSDSTTDCHQPKQAQRFGLDLLAAGDRVDKVVPAFRVAADRPGRPPRASRRRSRPAGSSRRMPPGRRSSSARTIRTAGIACSSPPERTPSP